MADPERASPSYERRLEKYSRKGWRVGVPGLEWDKVAVRTTRRPFAAHRHVSRHPPAAAWQTSLKRGVYTWHERELKELKLTFTEGARFPKYEVMRAALLSQSQTNHAAIRGDACSALAAITH